MDSSDPAALPTRFDRASSAGSKVSDGARSGVGRPLLAIPELADLRRQLRNSAATLLANRHADRALTREELGRLGRQLLDQHQLSEDYLGYCMVLLGNAAWMPALLSVPFSRRLLLLPPISHHSSSCTGQTRHSCAACDVAALRSRAEELGYTVRIADGSPAALDPILRGQVDGILGVASLADLEKAIDRILLAGVPSCAAPLRETPNGGLEFDRDWVSGILNRYEAAATPRPMSLFPLLRVTNRLFCEDFDRLLPRSRSGSAEDAQSPLGITEHVAFDWLANGGKRFRPFITLASFDAATGGHRHAAVQEGLPATFPDAVCRVAMAIEAFHKASLIHDDIQDDDLFRYGRDTLHRSHGLGPAINIGDYLIGLGYRLVGSCRAEFGAAAAADILDSMSQAHIRLCDGQGAEMAWRDQPDWTLSPQDALQIYALKTSPAFEAALYAGLRLAGPVEPRAATMVSQFCRELGVGFQILNDLKDWQGDQDNKLVAGQDALAIRPTVLLALALDSANDSQKAEIQEILESSSDDFFRLSRLRELFTTVRAFEKAELLVTRARSRSLALAHESQPEPVRSLLTFLVETVLADERIGSIENGQPQSVEEAAHA